MWLRAREAVLERDQHQCQAERYGLEGSCVFWLPLEVHHIRRRGQGGTHALTNLVTLCFGHHQWVTEHPTLAEFKGLSYRTQYSPPLSDDRKDT